jgi:hypothetical protein
MDKVIAAADEAVADIPDGAVIAWVVSASAASPRF